MNEERYFRVSDLRKLCDDSRDWGVPTFTADELREHGHWVIERGETVMHCNSCGWAYEYYGGLEEEWNFCPHCGAKMDEVEDEID